MPPSAPENVAARRIVGAVITLLVVLLPGLVCGVWLDTPVSIGEVERVELAIEDPRGEEYGPAPLYYGWMLPDELSENRADDVPSARLATILGMVIISAMTYVLGAVGRSRAVGVLACLVLAALPVARDCTLRPEVAAVVFGMLAVLVLIGVPAQLRQRRLRSIGGNIAVVTSLAVCVGLACALAASTMRAYGVYLLVPAGCLLLAIVLALIRFVVVMKRRRVQIEAFGGFNRRTVPWFAISFVPLACTMWMLQMVGETADPTVTEVGLLPASPWFAWPLVGLAALGAVAWILRLGLTIGRRRRVDADTVLFVFVFALLTQRMQFDPATDALAAAPALAIAVAVGARLALQWAIGFSAASSRSSP